MKPPRFLVSVNRLAKSNDQFITHTRNPALLVRIFVSGQSDPDPTNPLRVPVPNSENLSLELVKVWEDASDEVVQATLKRMGIWVSRTGQR